MLPAPPPARSLLSVELTLSEHEDPDLPAALLGADWPGRQLGPVLHRAFGVFAPSLEDYLATISATRSLAQRSAPEGAKRGRHRSGGPEAT